MTTWRDRLVPASFRGVGFHAEAETTPAGRRVQLTEYPKRDKPLAEDMGRMARIYKITAFVIGPDYMAQRDKLLEALEVQGVGELVHPWYGRIQVQVGQCECSHDRREGGMARFELTFYPDEGRAYPKTVANTAQQLTGARVGYLASALSRYKAAMALVDASRISVLSLRNRLSGVYGLIQSQAGPFAGLFDSVSGLVDALVNAPDGLSSLVANYFGSGSEAPSFSGYRESVASFSALTAGVASIQTDAASGAGSSSLAGGKDTAAAARALADLVQDTAIVQAAQVVEAMPVAVPPQSVAASRPAVSLPGQGAPATQGQQAAQGQQGGQGEQSSAAVQALLPPAASLPPVERVTQPPASVPTLDQQVVQPVTRPEVPVADDVLASREEWDATLFDASARAPHSHYQALTELRQRVGRHLSAVAASGVRLVVITPPENVPALVLAYQRHGDATRAAEIVQRNRVRHPGFIPPAPVQVAKE